MKPSQWVIRTATSALLIIEALLALRFILRLFNSDSSRLFIKWVYENSHSMVEPWLDWFPVRSGGITLELPTLAAMAAYAFLGYAFIAVAGSYRTKADGLVPGRRFSIRLTDRR